MDSVSFPGHVKSCPSSLQKAAESREKHAPCDIQTCLVFIVRVRYTTDFNVSFYCPILAKKQEQKV